MNNVKLRRILAGAACRYLLAALLLLGAAACEAVPDASDLPDIPDFPARPSPTVSRVDPESRPTATPLPAAATPDTPIPNTRKPEAAAPTLPARSVPAAGDVIRVPRLAIVEIPADLPDYSRKDWKHWVDADKDCQNTRAEVLVEESTADTAFKTDRNCLVTGGNWLDPYTGQTFNDPGDLDIDHLVPLKNAHLSGAWQWDAARKEDYANSRAADYHLIAVDKSANRAKGARGPEEWQPPDESYHCQYAQDWIAVKDAWELAATPEEWAALQEMLEQCPAPVQIVEDAPGR